MTVFEAKLFGYALTMRDVKVTLSTVISGDVSRYALTMRDVKLID